MLTIGIDDAGRGPLIGPMILAGVLLDENSEKALKNYKIADSKTLSHSVRIQLSQVIQDTAVSYHVESTSAGDIDHSLTNGINLNTLEAIKAAQVINMLNNVHKKIKVIVDCPSTNTTAWRKTLLAYIENPDNLDLHCEHKADANHLSVSAASILAKVERENSVSELKKDFGDFGSGYPSDPFTKEFLKKNGRKFADSGIFRKTWATWKKAYPSLSLKEHGQKKLF